MCDQRQLDAIKDIAIAAGREILAVYDSVETIAVSTKQDDSPLTDADCRAHRLIVEQLVSLTPDIPVLSEESELVDYQIRRSWQRYWLVDPLDGTKEFLHRNGEFTVNIALVENGKAGAGVVHVPVSGVSYFGAEGLGAWKQDSASATPHPISSAAMQDNDAVRIVASRRHRGEELDTLIEHLKMNLGSTELLSMGSSLKMCLLAEGKADIYPRLVPTSEWDTAAAHSILSAAGGEIVDLQFQPLRYNTKAELLNPYFFALADPHYPWQLLLEKLK